MSFRISSLLVACVLLSPASAQDAAPSKKAAGHLHVRFLAEQAPENLGKVFLQLGEKEKSDDFELPTNRLSEAVTISPRVMVLKTLEKGVPLCTITLPDSGNEFAVILVTAKPAGYKPIVVRTDDPAFKAGDVLFINRSEKTILGKLGTARLTLKPGESTTSHPVGPIDNTYYDIAFAVHDETGDKLISSSRWPVENDLRSYLFFFTNAQGRTVFRAVDEYLTVPAKP